MRGFCKSDCLLKEIINMPELKIKCQNPESLKNTIENMISDRLKSLIDGIAKTKKRLLEFEEKYQLSTQ